MSENRAMEINVVNFLSWTRNSRAKRECQLEKNVFSASLRTEEAHFVRKSKGFSPRKTHTLEE